MTPSTNWWYRTGLCERQPLLGAISSPQAIGHANARKRRSALGLSIGCVDSFFRSIPPSSPLMDYVWVNLAVSCEPTLRRANLDATWDFALFSIQSGQPARIPEAAASINGNHAGVHDFELPLAFDTSLRRNVF